LITRKGIQPVAKKVQAIHNLKSPTTTKQLWSFIGTVNYYQDIWIKQSHILAPLTKLVSKKQKFMWEKTTKITSDEDSETVLNWHPPVDDDTTKVNTNKNKNTIGYYVTTAQLLQQKKKLKGEHLSTITIGWLHSGKGSRKAKDLKRLLILFDTGCGGTLINQKFLKKLKTKKVAGTEWTTKAGPPFATSRKCNVSLTLPKFHEGRDINWTMYVDETDNKLSRDDMIIGRDLLEELGINFLLSQGIMTWDNASISMRNPDWLDASRMDELENKCFSMHDPVTTEVEWIQEILDAK
jgi:hypothetical protein